MKLHNCHHLNTYLCGKMKIAERINTLWYRVDSDKTDLPNFGCPAEWVLFTPSEGALAQDAELAFEGLGLEDLVGFVVDFDWSDEVAFICSA